MSNRSEIFSIRTILPVGLGIAIGLAIGAAALANVPAPRIEAPAAAAQHSDRVKPLSTKPGISFARIKKDGERCFLANAAQKAETICTH